MYNIIDNEDIIKVNEKVIEEDTYVRYECIVKANSFNKMGYYKGIIEELVLKEVINGQDRFYKKFNVVLLFSGSIEEIESDENTVVITEMNNIVSKLSTTQITNLNQAKKLLTNLMSGKLEKVKWSKIV